MHVDHPRTADAKARTVSRRTARKAKLARALFPAIQFPPYIAAALQARSVEA